VYLARSQLALNPSSFQPSPNAPTAIQAVKQLATYLATEDDHKEMIIDTIKDWLSSPELQKDPTLRILSSQIYLMHGMTKEALALVANDAENLEKLSMCVLIYLKIDRSDLAQKTLKAMQDLDDDDTLTQLATAWVGLSGNAPAEAKVTEAAFLLQELMEKFGPSVPVLNALAVADMHQRNYSNAFQYTKQARDLAIKLGLRPAAETLLNSIVCLQHLRKGTDVIQKIQAELIQNYPNHPWLKKQKEMDAIFEKHAQGIRAKQLQA